MQSGDLWLIRASWFLVKCLRTQGSLQALSHCPKSWWFIPHQARGYSPKPQVSCLQWLSSTRGPIKCFFRFTLLDWLRWLSSFPTFLQAANEVELILALDFIPREQRIHRVFALSPRSIPVSPSLTTKFPFGQTRFNSYYSPSRNILWDNSHKSPYIAGLEARKHWFLFVFENTWIEVKKRFVGFAVWIPSKHFFPFLPFILPTLSFWLTPLALHFSRKVDRSGGSVLCHFPEDDAIRKRQYWWGRDLSR